jgi:peptide/nickel transport system permease protein
MLGYILRRILQAIPIFIGVSLIVFAIIHLAPGSPVDHFRSPRVSPEAIQALIARYGLDKPLIEQYFKWITSFVQVWNIDAWGYSFLDGQPVLATFEQRAPATLLLTGTALLVTIVFAIPIGVIAAIRQYSWTDKIITTAATIGYAMPSFLIGTYILFLGGVMIGAFPLFGMQSLNRRNDWGDIAWHLVLPVTALAIQGIAAWARYMRSSMLDVMHQDYVRTARAKGLSGRSVIGKHALRNALIPIVTLLGLTIPTLIAGAAITEFIFSYPGLGQTFINAVGVRDYPTVLALTMVGAIAVILGNLIADVLYGVVDPRIKY